MPYTMPSISELEEFMANVKGHAQNKRQKKVASEVVEQFEKLVQYAREVTQALNSADTGSEYQHYSHWYGE